MTPTGRRAFIGIAPNWGTKASLLVALLLSVFALTAGLSACSSQPIDMKNVTEVIDVRTPQEFAEGHLQGAVNIDFEGTAFESEIKKLDPAGTYVLYCRSGNRAGKAVEAMKSWGYTNVTNAGGYTDASNATGLPLVQ